jgi:drug/metabolite transporter (DMT)-like permease
LFFSVLNGLLYLLIFVKGISLTTAGNVALIMASLPMWTAVLSCLFLSERLPLLNWIGLTVTLAGTVIVTTHSGKQIDLGGQFLFGNLTILAATITWSSATVVSRTLMQNITPLQLAAISCVLTTPVHLTLTWRQLPDEIPKLQDWLLLACLIYSGVLSTGIAYATWNAGVRMVGASHAAVYQNVVTLVAVLGGWVFLSEQISAVQVWGGLLTAAGLVLMRRGR